MTPLATVAPWSGSGSVGSGWQHTVSVPGVIGEHLLVRLRVFGCLHRRPDSLKPERAVRHDP